MNTTATAQAGNLKDDVSTQFNKGASKIADQANSATSDLTEDMRAPRKIACPSAPCESAALTA